MDSGFDRRRQELDVNDEEGLLALQAQFLAEQAGAQPAARVTRVSRKQPQQPATPPPEQQQLQPQGGVQPHAASSSAAAAATAGPAPAEAATPTATPVAQHQQQEEEQMCPAIPGILSDVKERVLTGSVVEPPAASAAAAISAASSASFPKAVHRKQSKFALGRRKQQASDVMTAPPPTAGAGGSSTPPAPSAAPPAAAAAGGATPQQRDPAVTSPAVASSAPSVATPASVESAGVDRANRQRIAEMSQEEVQEAQAEISQRFPAAVLQHLRKRHAAKKQQQQQGLEGAVAAPVDVGSSSGGSKRSSGGGAVGEAGAAAADVGVAGVGSERNSKASAAAAVAAGGAGLRKGFLGGGSQQRSAAATGAAAQQQQQQQHQQQQQQTASNTAGRAAAGGAGSGGGFKKGFLSQSKPQKQQQQQGAVATTAVPSAAAATWDADTQQQPVAGPLPAVARLRFSIHGQVLELAGPQTLPSTPEDVLMRDNISRASGAVPEGYTLPDIGVLVRSRHAPQRALGFKMLAAVLRRAQPLVGHVGAAGQLQPQHVLLDVGQQQQEGLASGQEKQQAAAATAAADTGVVWPDVWQYAVVALRAVLLCRLGLDEDNAQVLTAAADALRVLLGRSSSELLLEEVAATSSSISWPLSWRCQLRRLGAAGVWDSVENLVKAAQQDDSAAAAVDATSSLPDTPEDLAAVDPLAGFMAVDPLPRICFLLQQHADNTELVVSLLSVLEAAASASKAAAEAVVRTNGMTAALIALLGLGPLGGSSGGSNSGSSGGGCGGSNAADDDAGVGSVASCRVPVLRLLRQLCAASSMNTQLLRTAGLETAVQLLLWTTATSDSASTSTEVSAGTSSSAGGARQQHQQQSASASGDAAASASVAASLQKLEALRIWRVAAGHGVTLCHVDVMFTYIAALLQPPGAAHAVAAGSGSTNSSGLEASLKWQLSCEAFQLLEVLLRHALRVSGGAKTLGREMITPGCAAAVASAAAADWLQGRVIREVGQALVSLSDCQLPYGLDPNQAQRVQPYTASSSSSSSCPYRTEDTASEAAAFQRVLQSLHPAVMLPPALPLLCALAAVLQYLAAYWGTLQAVPKQLAGELLQQLDSVGLSDAAAAAGGGGGAAGSGDGGSLLAGGTSVQQAAAAAAAAKTALEASRQQLAMQLLTGTGSKDSAPQQQQQQRKVGGAVLQHCLSVLQAAGPAAAAPAAAMHVDGMGGTLSVHAMASAAAVMLLGLCELQQQLQQQQQQQQRSQQQEQQEDTVSTATCNSDESGSLVSRVLSVVSGNTLLWVQAAGRALVIEPWRWCHYTLQQYQLRLLLRLAPAVMSAAAAPAPVAAAEGEKRQQQQQQQLLWGVTDGLLSVLPLSAPGQEAQALQALQLLFDCSNLQQKQQQGVVVSAAAAGAQGPSMVVPPVPAGVLAAAAAAIQQLQQQGGALAAAAAGLKADALPPSNSSIQQAGTTELPYPPPVIVTGPGAGAAGSSSSSSEPAAASTTVCVDPAVWCKVLLLGYALTWLSVIADTSQAQQLQGASKPPPYTFKSSSLLLPLPQAYVGDCEGSRLPVPPEWLLSEVHAVPDSSSSSSCVPMHPVAAALLLALGLQGSGSRTASSSTSSSNGSSLSNSSSSCSRYMSCIQPGRRLEALLQLMYSFDAGELLPAVQPAPSGAAAVGAGRGRQQQQQLLEPAWQDAAARWASAVLAQELTREVVVGGGGAGTATAASTTAKQQQQELYPCDVNDMLQAARREGASKSFTSNSNNEQHLRRQQPQQQQLFPSWSSAPAASQLVDRLVRDLSELSFGDSLFGAHVALLLLPAAGSRLQRACWGSLMDVRGLHLLPPPWRCIGGSRAYLGADVGAEGDHSGSSGSSGGGCSGSSGSSSSDWGGFTGFDPQLVGDMAKALAQGELGKALQLRGLAGYMALHGVAALGLDQGAWTQDRVVGEAGASGGGGSEATGSKEAATASSSSAPASATAAASEAAIAVNVLRGVIRACDVETLAALVAAGKARGLDKEKEARALVQAAQGDAGLMSKVDRVLQQMQ